MISLRGKDRPSSDREGCCLYALLPTPPLHPPAPPTNLGPGAGETRAVQPPKGCPVPAPLLRGCVLGEQGELVRVASAEPLAGSPQPRISPLARFCTTSIRSLEKSPGQLSIPRHIRYAPHCIIYRTKTGTNSLSTQRGRDTEHHMNVTHKRRIHEERSLAGTCSLY